MRYAECAGQEVWLLGLERDPGLTALCVEAPRQSVEQAHDEQHVRWLNRLVTAVARAAITEIGPAGVTDGGGQTATPRLVRRSRGSGRRLIVESRPPEQGVAAGVEVLGRSVQAFDFDFHRRCRDCFIAGGAPLTDTGATERLIGGLERKHPGRELRHDPGAKLIVAEMLNQGSEPYNKQRRAVNGRSTDRPVDLDLERGARRAYRRDRKRSGTAGPGNGVRYNHGIVSMSSKWRLGPHRPSLRGGQQWSLDMIVSRIFLILAGLVLVASVTGCGGGVTTPTRQDGQAVMSEYKGWIISVTPSLTVDRWGARVRVWPPEVRPANHPGIFVRFSETAVDRRAIEQAATVAARRYVDGSQPVHPR